MTLAAYAVTTGFQSMQAVAPTATLAFWAIGLIGWRQGEGGLEPRSRRHRHVILALGLAPCFGLALAAAPEAGLVPPLLAGLLAGLSLLSYLTVSAHAAGKTEPWYQRKARLAGGVLALAGPVLLASITPRPELAVAATAFAVLMHHQRRSAELAADCQLEREALRVKVLSLEAALRLHPDGQDLGQRDSGSDIGDDKVQRAG
jgi:hypothetical protein